MRDLLLIKIRTTNTCYLIFVVRTSQNHYMDPFSTHAPYFPSLKYSLGYREEVTNKSWVRQTRANVILETGTFEMGNQT